MCFFIECHYYCSPLTRRLCNYYLHEKAMIGPPFFAINIDVKALKSQKTVNEVKLQRFMHLFRCDCFFELEPKIANNKAFVVSSMT